MTVLQNNPIAKNRYGRSASGTGPERNVGPTHHATSTVLILLIDGALGVPDVPAAMAPSSLSFSAGNFFDFLA